MILLWVSKEEEKEKDSDGKRGLEVFGLDGYLAFSTERARKKKLA